VESRRTEVPAGGIFDSQSEVWNVPPSEAKQVLSDYNACHTSQACDAAEGNLLVFAARHWGDPVPEYQTWVLENRDEKEDSWSAPNLLRTYDFKFPDFNPNINRVRRTFSIKRTICFTRTNRLPQSAKISCEPLFWKATVSLEIANNAQKGVDRAMDLWRLDSRQVAWESLQSAASEKKLPLSANLDFVKCESYPLDGDEFTNCDWMSRDGMQVATVVLKRYASLVSPQRPKDRTVWVAVAVNIKTCRAE
jgi:hypothetical protein